MLLMLPRSLVDDWGKSTIFCSALLFSSLFLLFFILGGGGQGAGHGRFKSQNAKTYSEIQ